MDLSPARKRCAWQFWLHCPNTQLIQPVPSHLHSGIEFSSLRCCWKKNQLNLPTMVRFTLSIDTSTPAFKVTKLATLVEILTWALTFSTTSEISSTLRLGTWSQTSGGLLMLKGNAVQDEFLLFGQVELVCAISPCGIERTRTRAGKMYRKRDAEDIIVGSSSGWRRAIQRSISI